MADITLKDKQLRESRLKVLEQEEEMKKLSLITEKYRLERNHLMEEMKKAEIEIN